MWLNYSTMICKGLKETIKGQEAHSRSRLRVVSSIKNLAEKSGDIKNEKT